MRFWNTGVGGKRCRSTLYPGGAGLNATRMSLARAEMQNARVKVKKVKVRARQVGFRGGRLQIAKCKLQRANCGGGEGGSNQIGAGRVRPPASELSNTVTTLLQHCYNTVTTLLQHCYNTVTTLLQHCYNSVQGCDKSVTNICPASCPKDRLFTPSHAQGLRLCWEEQACDFPFAWGSAAIGSEGQARRS